MTTPERSYSRSQLEAMLPRSSPAAMATTISGGLWKMAPHLDLLNRKLVELTLGIISRLIVQMPPRHGKSMLTSHYLPTWFLGMHPEKRVILCAHEASFAATWGRKVRNELQAIGKELFGVSVSPDSRAADRWNLAQHEGGMLTAGVGGPITGQGADLLIVDDYCKNAEEAASEAIRDNTWNWWQSTAYTRLQPGGGCAVIATRWHEDDLIGRILARAADEGERWEVLSFPAIAEEDEHWPDGTLFRREGEALWPAQFPLDVLQAKQRSLDPYWWRALYQQSPGQHERAEWPTEYFAGDDLWFHEWPTPGNTRLRVIALDPSKGKSDRADYSAYVLAALTHDGLLYVQANMARRPVEQLVSDGVDLHCSFRPNAIYVESNAWQDLLAGEFDREFAKRGLMTPLILGGTNSVNKLVRIRRLGPWLGQRKVRFKANCRSTELLFKQLKDFPTGKHDDGPDACEQALQTLEYLASASAQDDVSFGLAVLA